MPPAKAIAGSKVQCWRGGVNERLLPPDQEVTPMSLPHETRVVARHYFGLRLDELSAVHQAMLPVGLER
jgi:hypothetical protein